MNKIFKVVWSKSKQCYVVVSEMAKNNSGKKKVLASVLAALAVVGAGAAQVDAASYGAGGGNAAGEASVSIGGGYSGANTAANGKWAVAVGDNAHAINEGSIAMGYQATTSGDNSIAIGRNSKSNAAGAIAIGKDNSSNNIRAVAIGEQNTAQDADTIAMGHKNTAKTGGLAIGSGNTADATAGGGRSAGNSQIAIGWDNSAKNEDTIAIGRGTTASARLATAIGRNADALGIGSIAFGSNGEPDASGIAYRTTSKGMGSVAVGMGAGTDGLAAVALGGMSKAEADGATAISLRAKSLSKKSVAIGQESIVNKQKATSNYEFSGSNGTLSPAGYNTETITVNSASAPAGGAVAGNYYDAGSGIAIGNGATVSDESDRAVVVGPDAKTNGNAHYSVVLGSGSHADASDGFVGGHGSYVESRESIAMGSGAHVSGNENIRSQAIGYGATVSGTGAYDATAIGATAQVTGVQGGVALGSGSLLSRTTNSNENLGWNSKYLNGTAVRNRAYKATVNSLNDQWDAGAQIGAVSVGNDDQKRQIINVAAGNKDTDAVNVAQLKNVGVRVGADTNTATINGQKVAADFLAYNGQLNIKGDGNRVSTVSENDANGKDANVNVKFDYSGLVKGKGNITVEQKTDSLGKTVYEVSSTGGSSSSWNLKSTGNTTKDSNKTAKTIEDTNTVNMVAGKNLTVKQTNNTDGADVEFALNKDLDLTKDGSLTIGDTKLVNGGLTITGGPSITKTGINAGNKTITNVSDGVNDNDAVNVSQLKAVAAKERHIKPGTYAVDGNGKVTMKYVDGDNHDVAGEAVITGIAKQDLSNINNAGKNVITGLGTIVKAGDNVNVSESSDATTGQKTYTVNAVTPVVYTKADGTKVVKRPDGTFTTNLDGASGNDVDKADVIASFVDGNGNVTGGNMVINNVGSAIDKTGTSTGDTFLTKLDTAATNTPNAAVNVKDLKTTSDALVDKGLKFTGNNTGTENAHKLGSLVKVQGEGLAATDVPSFASAAGNIAVVANGTDTLELKLNKNLKGINSVNNGSTAIVLNDAPNATTPAVTIKGGNLSLGDGTTNNKIVNVAPGTNDTDAVNYSQIKGLRTEVKPGSNVTVAKSHGTDGHDIYTISATATGGTASSWNIKSSADTANGGATATGHDANAVTVSDQKTVEMVAGKNLTVKQAATTDGAKVEFALSDEIGVGEKGQPGVPGKDGIDGKIGVNGKDGSAVVINGKDGSIGLNGKDGANGLSIKGDKGADGVDGKNGTNGMTRIVYEDNSNTKHEVATLDDGLKFAGDDAQGTDKSKVITKKLNNTVDIIGGANSTNLTDNNIGVNNDNGKLKVQLAKTIDLTKDGSVTTGNTKVDNGGVTITAPTGGTTTNVTLTQSGLDNGGNKIVNVKEGTADTDAVNVKQLKDAKTVLVDGKNTKKDGAGTAANPYKVNVEGDLVDISSITNGNGSGKLSFGPNQTVTVDGDHSITLNAKTGKIGGLQNKTFDPNNFTSGQAATEDQLKSVHDTLKASELHIAPTTGTTEDKGGTASGSTNVYKYDATNKTVTLTYNDGNGQAVSGPKAVIDFSALNVTPGNNYGFNTNAGGNLATGTTASVKPVASGKTVTYAAGKNLTVEQKETNGDLTYTYALDKDLTNLDKIVVNGKDGQPGHDGVTITGPQGTAGVDGNNGKVGISGTDGKDAVSISGKDGVGHIGLTGPAGKDGKDATADITVKDGVPGVDGAPGDSMTRIVYKDKDGKDHEVATHDDGMKFAGDNGQTNQDTNPNVIKKHLNNVVDIIGGATGTLTDNNIGVNADNGKLKVQLAKDINLTKDGSLTIGGTKVDGNGLTITGGPSVTKTGIDAGNKAITNVANGTNDSDAVNVSQLKAVAAKERHIKPGTYAVDGNGKVTMKYVDGDNHDVAGEAVITGIAKQDLSNINNAGKNVITGLGTIVKAGDNVNVSESSDATTGQKTYTVNAVTPVVYTKADGTKVVKRPDGTFTTNLDGASGNDVDKADVIASFVDGNGNVTGGNMVINNVGSAIDKTGTSTGDTFLTKLDTAATNTPNAAVNVKDLKTTSDALVDKGLKFTGNNTGTENAHKLGSLVKVQGEGLAATDVPSFASAAGNIAVVANGTDTLELKLNKNLKGINSVNNGSTAIVLNDAPNATTPAVTIKGGNLSLGDGTTNNKIVNVAPGTNDTDAVNYSQIKGLRTEVKPGSNVTVAKSHGTDGHDIYTISATATGGTASSWNIKSSADTANGGATATGHDANAVTVSDQKTVEMVAGKNLTVKQAATTDGAKVEFALSDEIGVGEKGQPGVPGKDGIDGKIGVNGKDGSAVVINGKDGSIGLNGKDGANGLSIKGDKGADGVDGKNGTNGMTRIVYEDNSNTKHEVATLDDGLKFAGDDAQGTDKSKVITKKLNNTVDIIGGANSTNLTDNNIGVNNDNGKLKVQLAKTIDLTKDGSVTTGNTKVDNGGVTITAPTGGTTTNVTLTQSGLDNGGNKIVNVKEGTADTDAVNVKQLKDAKTVLVDGKNTKKDGAGTAANPYKVNVEGDLVDISSITNGNGSGKLSFGPNQTVTVDGDHSITLNAKTGKIGGLQNKTFDPNNFTSGQAATEDQLKSVHDTLKASELHIAPTTGTTEDKGGTASGSTNVYKYDATNKTVTLTYNDGNGQAVSGPKAVIDFSALNVTPGNNYGFNTNAGGNLATGTTASVKPVASGKTVTYAAGKNLTVEQKETNGDLTYTYALDKDLTNLDKIVVNGKDGQPGHDGVTITGPQGTAGVDGNNGKVGISGTDGKDAVSISGKDGVGHIGLTGPAGKDGKDATADITVKDGVPGVDGAPGDSMTRIVYKDKDGKDHEVATHDDGMKFAGDNGQTNQDTNPNVIKKHLNNVVDIIGGATGTLTDNNIGVNADNGKLKVQLAKDINLTKDGSLTIGGTKVDGNGLTITGGPSVTKTGIDAGNKAITNVANGTNDSDAVNVSQLKGSITTVKSSDGSITVTDANAGSTDPTKGHAYDIKVNNQGVVNNAQLPVEYTKADGTKVYKQPNGTFNTAKDGSGDVVNAGDVIASMNNGSDSTTTPMKLANVGSSIAGQSGSTYLDKINAAASNPNTTNNAVNVSDLKDTAKAIGDKGLNFGAQSGTDIHKNLGEKLEIVGGGQKADSEYDASNIKTMTKDGKVVVALDKNIKADTVTVGKDGKDGVDGKIGVNGKDGASVTINGKDGSIGLQGPKGADGKDGASATIKVKDGVPGVDGKDGETLTRIVYETKDGVEHQVATHDDGLKFTGNNTSTVNKHHLNSLVKVQGEGVTEAQSTSFQSAAGNINVKANGTDTLEVQLNKDLKGINSIRNSATGPAMAFNTGDIAISGGNLNMGDNKITNVGPGTDGTDAVNLNQLKAARTVVTSKDGSVTVTPNENQATHEMTYDLKVNGAHDPRVDQLNEEIGRVGAQGAALAALKPIQYDPLEPTQIMAGYGNYRGNSALAVGVAHYKNESTMLHAGMSWAGGSSHMMANAGVTWKFGNRDAENAIADRYRKGPISAAYALQNEMAAVKAQNAGLKSEVSDLKAENQQMKAQIAAMMAKLGL